MILFIIVKNYNFVKDVYIMIEIISNGFELFVNIIKIFLLIILLSIISFIIMMILIITISLFISLFYVVIIVNDEIFIINPLFLSNVMIVARLNHVMMNRFSLVFIITFDIFMIFHIIIVTFVVFVVMNSQSIVLNFSLYSFRPKT